MRIRFLLLASVFIATPALADHAGPTTLGSSGGLTVFAFDTLDARQWAAGFRLIYTRPDQRSDDLLADLAGQHIHAHNTNYNLNASAGLAYGITHHLTLSAELPYIRRQGLREGEHAHVDGQSVNEVARLGTVAGIGDLSLLAKYRLTHSDSGGFALIGGIKVPTGSTRKKSAEGERLETEHQPGTGSWDPIVGAAGGMKLGAVQINASALYRISGKGAQHTRLGNRAQGGIALSHRFGRAEHHHEEAGEDHHHEEVSHQQAEPHGHASWDAFVEMTGEWEGRQKVDGEVETASGGKSVWLSPGFRFNSASAFSVATAIGLPVRQRIRPSHPENDYRVTLSIGRAF